MSVSFSKLLKETLCSLASPIHFHWKASWPFHRIWVGNQTQWQEIWFLGLLQITWREGGQRSDLKLVPDSLNNCAQVRKLMVQQSNLSKMWECSAVKTEGLYVQTYWWTTEDTKQNSPGVSLVYMLSASETRNKAQAVSAMKPSFSRSSTWRESHPQDQHLTDYSGTNEI